MIDKEEKVEYAEAYCDSCSADLLFYPPGTCTTYAFPNYGELSHHFGYGSRLDDITHPSYHLCEDCWERTLKFLELSETRNGSST